MTEVDRMGKFHKAIELQGSGTFLLAVNIVGHGAPTEHTEAEPGMIYMDVDSENGDLYKCIKVTITEQGSIWLWKKLVESQELEILKKEIATKANKTGWTANKYLGTDADGNMVEKEAPQTGTGGITEETDPTVPAWAKEPEKPTYTASEVGALPASTEIPANTSDLNNDSGYITIAVATLLNYYLKTEVYAKAETYSQTEVDNLISGLDKRLNAIADSEDVDLDQFSELVAYIKANKSLIDSITTSKVNVADIIDNLTTADSKKPLSAAQGKALKAMYDALPAWAKASTKPTYTQSEVGLGNVDNVRQYSASNPPPYPVKSVNGKTGAVTLGAADVGAATVAQFSQLSEKIVDQQTQLDGKQPKGNYLTEIPAGYVTETELEAEITDLKAQGLQQTPLYPEGETVDECLAWLAENGDQSKVYLLPDGVLYAYMEYENSVAGDKPLFTNRAIPTSSDWKANSRFSSSSGSISSCAGAIVSNAITAKKGDIIRVKGLRNGTTSATNIAYVGLMGYSDANVETKQFTTPMFFDKTKTQSGGGVKDMITVEDGAYVYPAFKYLDPQGATIEHENSASVVYIRVSGEPTTTVDDIIVTVNEKIEYSQSSTETGYRWQSTGHAFIPADYEDRIVAVENKTTQHSVKIAALEKAAESGSTDETEAAALEKIKVWDKPVYDSAPVTLLGDERTKPALTKADMTVAAIHAKYRALMAAHPRYIRETNLGPCTSSDTFPAVDMLRFDFCEPIGLTEPTFGPEATHETKPKIIFISGIHKEWAGVYGLYYALEEITTNPAFYDIRRNAHIIVVPCANPFGLTDQTAIEGWQMSHVNANGIAPHNNFGVNHRSLGTVGEYNYGGTTPYSELENQYIDAVMADNSDAIAFVTCHNNNYSTYYGSHVIWASSATYHMCNLTFRLVDKMTTAWLDKYGQTLKNAIDQYKFNMDADDYRLGRATMSTSRGTEQANATKYGILATNLEIPDRMRVFSGETTNTSEVMTRGAEVYANFIRIILATYDANDRKTYAPNLPWSD